MPISFLPMLSTVLEVPWLCLCCLVDSACASLSSHGGLLCMCLCLFFLLSAFNFFFFTFSQSRYGWCVIYTFQVCNIVVHRFLELYSIYNDYKILTWHWVLNTPLHHQHWFPPASNSSPPAEPHQPTSTSREPPHQLKGSRKTVSCSLCMPSCTKNSWINAWEAS